MGINLLKLVEFSPGYFISKKGKVYSTRGRGGPGKSGTYPPIKKAVFVDKKTGYVRVNFRNKENKIASQLVHILVAKAYIPNPENKPEVNHIWGDKQDNYYKHLQWATKKENMEHAVKHGLYRCWNKTKTPKTIRKIRRLRRKGWTLENLAIRFNSNMGGISNICNLKSYRDVN